MSGQSWHDRSACAVRGDLPWTAEPDRLTAWDVESMRAVCASCPVLTECRTAATDLEAVAGWWAGQHYDPAYTEPVTPTWVPIKGSDAEQGSLPLDLGGAA